MRLVLITVLAVFVSNNVGVAETQTEQVSESDFCRELNQPEHKQFCEAHHSGDVSKC